MNLVPLLPSKTAGSDSILASIAGEKSPSLRSQRLLKVLLGTCLGFTAHPVLAQRIPVPPVAAPSPAPAQAPAQAIVPIPAPVDPGSTARALSAPTVTPMPSTAFEVYTDYNWGNAIAEKLRNATPKLYNFDRASLRDVLRFLADDAGIPFVALQESAAAENTLVTFTLKASPFLALETVARSNGVNLLYENGVWFMRPINEKELIGRIYKLKYNPQENVTYNGGGTQSGATTGVSTGGGTSGGIPDLNVNIQGASQVFQVETPETVDQIKSLLGIPTSGLSAQMATETDVENLGSGQPAPTLNASGGQLNLTDSKGDSGAQVIYNSDANTIYVIATRQQHQWVEGFLSAVDRPQALIAIEVKFFETNKNPIKELGVDWQGTLAGGYAVTASNIGASVDINAFVNPVTGAVTGGVVTPFTATLNANDIAVNLKAFLQDRDTTTVSYPRVLTLNNREVVIRSVVNQPVLASTSSVTPGVGGTTTASVSYLPIGTIINVLPKTMPDGSVVLNVAITISSIVGDEIIQGNPYPIASSRVYNAALQVNSGYTLAIGGLDEAFDDYGRNGVPLLKDIPLVGEFFKSKTQNRKKKNLLIFITPTVINNRTQTAGISETPESVTPIRPDDAKPPMFDPNGRLIGGIATMDTAIAWVEQQVRYFRNLNEEKRTDKRSIKQLNSSIDTAEMLAGEIQRLEDENPAQINTLLGMEERALEGLKQLNKVRGKAGRTLMGY